MVTVTKKIVSSVWTGAAGDGDVSNPANWRSAVAFFDTDGNEIAEIAETYDGVAPAEDTPVRVPAGLDLGGLVTGEVSYVVDSDISLVAGFDATYENYAAGRLVATENLKILNNLNGLLKSAVAWYDPSDVATLTVGDDGFVKTVANKGYLGSKSLHEQCRLHVRGEAWHHSGQSAARAIRRFRAPDNRRLRNRIRVIPRQRKEQQGRGHGNRNR